MTAQGDDAQTLAARTEQSLVVLFHTTMAEVAKASIDRARDSAKYVQTAAAAVNALYVAVLGLVFSVTDHPLPLRGIYPTLFLAAAVGLSTAYLAFLTKPKSPPIWPYGQSPVDNQVARSSWLVEWVNSTVLHRRYAIRSSVLALGIGVLLIPAPFVTLSRARSVPEAPVAPAIPAQIAPAVQASAAALFEAQVKDFQAVRDARAKALEQAEKEADREPWLNVGFGAVALLGVLAVAAGPWAWARYKME